MLRHALHCRPYDTMEEVIGLRGTQGHGSLLEWGVTYRELPLAEQGLIDWDALRIALTPREHWSPYFLPLPMYTAIPLCSEHEPQPKQALSAAALCRTRACVLLGLQCSSYLAFHGTAAASLKASVLTCNTITPAQGQHGHLVGVHSAVTCACFATHCAHS